EIRNFLRWYSKKPRECRYRNMSRKNSGNRWAPNIPRFGKPIAMVESSKRTAVSHPMHAILLGSENCTSITANGTGSKSWIQHSLRNPSFLASLILLNTDTAGGWVNTMERKSTLGVDISDNTLWWFLK